MSKLETKKKNSTIIGSALQAQEPLNKIGMQLGKNGFVQQVRDLVRSNTIATPEAMIQCRQCFLDLSKRPLRVLTEIERMEAHNLIEWASKPSPRAWLSSRIVTLLSHYFISYTDERVAKAAAEDWIEILREMPPWAIQEACRDYLAGPDCRKKPMAGDILKLAKVKMGAVYAASNSLSSRDHQTEDAEIAIISDDDRREVGEKIKKLRDKMVMSGNAFNAKPDPSASEIAKSKQAWAEIEVSDGPNVATKVSSALLETPIMKKNI